MVCGGGVFMGVVVRFTVGYYRNMKNKRSLPESPEGYLEFIQNNVTELEYKAAKMRFLEDMKTGCYNLANLSVPPPWRGTDKPRNWLYSEDFPDPETFYTPTLRDTLRLRGVESEAPEREKVLARFFMDKLDKEDFVGQWLKEDKGEGEDDLLVAGPSPAFVGEGGLGDDRYDLEEKEADEEFIKMLGWG